MNQELSTRIGQACLRMSREYRDDVSRSVADLAILRRGLGRSPGDDLGSWSIVLRAAGDALDAHGDEPSASEWAAHTALTLFAFHQQGERGRSAHRQGPSMGAACRELVGSTARVRQTTAAEAEDGIRRRFHALGTATSITELAHHARSIVGLLRSSDISLDYARLTEDLERWQRPTSAASVRLRWGRDFYRLPSDESTPNSAEGATS